MSDIVERLRDHIALNYTTDARDDIVEAADEIDLLRAEVADQIKWASYYAARAGRLEDALMHLHQAYANKHSPQHRKAALISAAGALGGEGS